MSIKSGSKKILRLFSAESYKGTRDYVRTQRVYEILRTTLYFGISLSLFVNMIMFLRYKGLSREAADRIAPCEGALSCLYDMVFTAYSGSFVVGHMAVKGNTVCGYSERRDFPEKDFQTHLDPLLKADGHKNVTVKIFTDLDKYTERLRQMQTLEAETDNTGGIVQTLKSVVL